MRGKPQLFLGCFTKFRFFIAIVYLCLPGHYSLDVSQNPNDIHFYLYPLSSNSKFKEELTVTGSSTGPNFNKFPFGPKKQNLTRSRSGWNSGRSNIKNSWDSFKPGQITVIIIHDFGEDGESNTPQTLKDAYLQESYLGGNYIIVDWGLLATPQSKGQSSPVVIDGKSDYQKVVNNVPLVGKSVESFISYMVKNLLVSHYSVHVIGFGLGAHVAGTAGDAFQKQWFGTQLWRITALDPSGPLFGISSPARKLVKQDAHFVDTVQTNGGFQGDLSVHGLVNFYVNGGLRQPGCDDVTTLGLCSHNYAVLIYLAAFKTQIFACRCSTDWDTHFLKDCLLFCPTPTLLGMNAYLPGAIGNYYVVSNLPPPSSFYLRGPTGTNSWEYFKRIFGLIKYEY